MLLTVCTVAHLVSDQLPMGQSQQWTLAVKTAPAQVAAAAAAAALEAVGQWQRGRMLVVVKPAETKLQ